MADEELYVEFDDFEFVKDYIDYWGVLYVPPKKDTELKYAEKYRSLQAKDEAYYQNTVRKAARQEARQPFFEELTTRQLKNMSPNVKWEAKQLVRAGCARLVL